MTTERIKEIQAETAYPNSRSVQQALLKVWNECEQERVKNCSIPNVGRSLSSAEYVEGLSKEVLDRMHQNTTVVTNENDRDIWDTAFILGYYGGLEGK